MENRFLPMIGMCVCFWHMAIWRFSRTVREIERMRRFTEFEGELVVMMVIITGHGGLLEI